MKQVSGITIIRWKREESTFWGSKDQGAWCHLTSEIQRRNLGSWCQKDRTIKGNNGELQGLIML